jgi:hypothetical protein
LDELRGPPKRTDLNFEDAQNFYLQERRTDWGILKGPLIPQIEEERLLMSDGELRAMIMPELRGWGSDTASLGRPKRTSRTHSQGHFDVILP